MLSSSSVKIIHQDNYGFVWITTDFGLSKFDGYHFQNYYHVHRDSTTLPENNIGSIMTDQNGDLWIGQGKGLVKYDYASDCFVRQHFPNEVTPRVTSLIQDKTGNLYIGTAGLGMYMMDQGTGKIVRAGEFSDKMNNIFIGHMYIDRRGNLWKGSHKNLIYLYNIKDGKILSYRE